ncbi:MAG: hypothetical protein IJ752_07705 [Alphaproteobacteria bacterium]|nr:hypothetical protein [Alphaproteobacteria bacterium]
MHTEHILPVHLEQLVGQLLELSELSDDERECISNELVGMSRPNLKALAI